MNDEREERKRTRDDAIEAALIEFYGSPEELAKQRALTQKRLDGVRKMAERGYDFTSPGQSERHQDDDARLDRERAKQFEADQKREQIRAIFADVFGADAMAELDAVHEKRLEQLRKMEEAGCDLTPAGMSERHMDDDPVLYRQQARENEERRKAEAEES